MFYFHTWPLILIDHKKYDAQINVEIQYTGNTTYVEIYIHKVSKLNKNYIDTYKISQ